MKDIILGGIALFFLGGAIFFSVVFVATACKMQKMEGAENRP